MEDILQMYGRLNEGSMEPSKQQKVASLRAFRNTVLGELQPRVGERYTVQDLRHLYGRLLADASQGNQAGRVLWEVPAYWEEKLKQLPDDQDTPVTDDDVANALLQWLRELLQAEIDAP